MFLVWPSGIIVKIAFFRHFFCNFQEMEFLLFQGYCCSVDSSGDCGTDQLAPVRAFGTKFGHICSVPRKCNKKVSFS